MGLRRRQDGTEKEAGWNCEVGRMGLRGRQDRTEMRQD
jgi:hypothetical protein